MKSIPKVLRDPAASERKKASQIPYLKREVEVLLALRGTLNVANLEVCIWGNNCLQQQVGSMPGWQTLCGHAVTTSSVANSTAQNFRLPSRPLSACGVHSVVFCPFPPPPSSTEWQEV